MEAVFLPGECHGRGQRWYLISQLESVESAHHKAARGFAMDKRRYMQLEGGGGEGIAFTYIISLIG